MFNTAKIKEHIPEELQLFDHPTVMSSISDSYTMDILPLNQSTDSEVLEFLIAPSEHFISPSEMDLYLKCVIRNLDTLPESTTQIIKTVDDVEGIRLAAAAGENPNLKTAPNWNLVSQFVTRTRDETAGTTTITTTKNPDLFGAAPVNAFLHAMFDHCEVELNSVPLEFGYRDYPYKAYFNMLLAHPKESKKTILRNALWLPDTGFEGDRPYLTKATDGTNEGLTLRYQFAKSDNRPFEMIGRIWHEIFHQIQCIPPGVQMRIRLYRKSPAFCLMSPAPSPNYKIQILDARLSTKFVKVSSSFQQQFEHKLSTTPAVYTIYDATDVRARQLQSGLRFYSLDNFFGGERVPNRVVFALVDHLAYTGSYLRNPFFFNTFHLEEINLVIESDTHTHRIDNSNKNYIKLHTAILTMAGDRNCGVNPCIKYEDVLAGTALFPFDLTPNRDTSDLQVPHTKNARVELRFTEDLESNVTLLAFIEYQKVIEINKERQVTVTN